jgi:hypothetical protein
VKAHLLREIRVDAAAAEQRTKQSDDLVDDPHASLRRSGVS